MNDAERLERAVRALQFYACARVYDAVGFWFDYPTGGFDEDFDTDHGSDQYERPMPGKEARAALRDIGAGWDPDIWGPL